MTLSNRILDFMDGTLAPDIDVHRAAVLLYGVYFSWFTFFVISDRMTMEHLRTEVRQATALVVRGLRSEHAQGMRGRIGRARADGQTSPRLRWARGSERSTT